MSRTFSRPIEALRPNLRTAVTCGYLLCRVVDTIEDDAELGSDAQDRLYGLFLSVLECRAQADRFSSAYEELRGATGPEQLLASNLPRVMRVVDTLPAAMRATCLQWVAEMTRGMQIYSHRSAGPNGYFALATLGDLERYCYFVAGTVGHMLTGLFTAELETIDEPRAQRLRGRAEEFGLGLQLVNILKDITDDRQRQWSFIPQSVIEAEGLTLDTFTDPDQRTAAHRALAPVFDRAQRALDGAFEYCLALPPEAHDIRVFCLMPLWLAVRTLVHARNNDAQLIPEEPVKISREEVFELIAECGAAAGDDEALTTAYRRLWAEPSRKPEVTADFSLEQFMEGARRQVDRALEALLPSTDEEPARLHEAMRYGALAGGKRLRPALALAACEAVGGNVDQVLRVAAAIECVHTYSLLHDDLPALDDDDLRRGRPTCHKVYGEALALLAGDALLNFAFETLSLPAVARAMGEERLVRVISELANASGSRGMVGGQVLDLEAEERSDLVIADIETLHAYKTGALITASVVSGGVVGGANANQLEALRAYGQRIGLAFQIVDDILDVTSATDVLGKPQGSDEKNGKTTFVGLLGLDGSRQRAARLITEAKAELALFGDKAKPLIGIADFIENRTH